MSDFLESIKEVVEELMDRRSFGVSVGIVTNNKDPDGEGKVKIKFPGLSDSSETWWARAATFMTGSGMGSFFLPEVGDEVLVVFEHGNHERPYVVGSLWNGKAKPPLTNSDGKNNIRKIKSRSGHEIVFDDTGQKEKLEIKTNAGHKIVMDDASGQEKIEIKDKSGNKITVKSQDNSISITCSGEVTISAQKEVVIDSAAIKLGKSARNTLVLDTFIDAFNSHTHTGNMGAPTSPPTQLAIKKSNCTDKTKGA